MNISSSVSAPTVAPQAASSSSAVQTSERAEPAISEKIGQEPVKLHFPWLSRLATKLEAVSENHWPFKSLPVAGENINNAA